MHVPELEMHLAMEKPPISGSADLLSCVTAQEIHFRFIYAVFWLEMMMGLIDCLAMGVQMGYL